MMQSIIIPAYNEEQRISAVLKSVADYFTVKNFNAEIIIIDDGSTDRTEEVAKRYAGKLPNFQFIKLSKNFGKGAAVKAGIESAKGDWRLFMDADNSVGISNLEKFLEAGNNGFDIVIGSIGLPGSKIEEHNAFYRRLLGLWSKSLIRKIAVPGISDTQRGFKLYSKKAAEITFSRQTIRRFGFDIENLAIAQRHNLRIKELPVEWSNPPGSKVGLLSYFATLSELLKIKFNQLRKKYD